MKNRDSTHGTITISSKKQAGAAFLPDFEYQCFKLGAEYKGASVRHPRNSIYMKTFWIGAAATFLLFRFAVLFLLR